MPVCIGCTKTTDAAPVHILSSGQGTDELRIAWHHDCHQIATDCELCSSVVTAYPALKDAALGQAIISAPHPYTQEG